MENKDLQKNLKYTYIVWRESNKVYEEIAKKFQINSTLLNIYIAFMEYPEDCTQNRISEEWFIPKQTVNNLLKKFEREGKITFKVNPVDKRNKIISLNPSFKDEVSEIIHCLNKLEIKAIQHVGMDLMNTCNDILHNYCQALHNELSEVKK